MNSKRKSKKKLKTETPKTSQHAATDAIINAIEKVDTFENKRNKYQTYKYLHNDEKKQRCFRDV